MSDGILEMTIGNRRQYSNLVADITETHTVCVWRGEDNGKILVPWTTVSNYTNGQLTSVHRLINGVRQGLTEVWHDGRHIADVVYVGGRYKRMITL